MSSKLYWEGTTMAVADLAEYMKISRSTLYTEVLWRPDFPKPRYVGKRKRWLFREVQAWLNGQTT